MISEGRKIVNKFLMHGVAMGLLFFSQLSCYADNLSAKDLIYNFYQAYFSYNHQKQINTKAPQLVFSKAFNQLSDQNVQLCQHFPDEICGWGADEDIYLNAQDSEDNLTIANTGFQISQSADGLINVSFDLFPSDKSGYGKRDISYKMIYEDNAWVVDDVIYEKKYAARDEMTKENEDMHQRIKNND